jgi:phosphoglycolate phosphatase-like HAD superfamily hydrolase
MPSEKFIFTGFDDVLVNSAELHRQFLNELSSQFAKDTGKTSQGWLEQLSRHISDADRRQSDFFLGNPLAGYNTWMKEEKKRGIDIIFQVMQISSVDNEDPVSYAARKQFDALTCCSAATSESGDMLLKLFEKGYRTQLASHRESEFLLAALIGAGIESYTESKFGPDLIDFAKESPVFYQRIFDVFNINPHEVIVLDAHSKCLQWADEAGAGMIFLAPGSTDMDFPKRTILLHSLDEIFSYLPE